MKYLLDTCIVSKFLKDDENVCTRIGLENSASLNISMITKLEINYGLALHPNDFQKQRKRWNDFCDFVEVLPLNNLEQISAVQIKADLHKRGQMIGSYDILIAATAIANGLICVTNNTKEFERVIGLTLEDWTWQI